MDEVLFTQAFAAHEVERTLVHAPRVTAGNFEELEQRK